MLLRTYGVHTRACASSRCTGGRVPRCSGNPHVVVDQALNQRSPACHTSASPVLRGSARIALLLLVRFRRRGRGGRAVGIHRLVLHVLLTHSVTIVWGASLLWVACSWVALVSNEFDAVYTQRAPSLVRNARQVADVLQLACAECPAVRRRARVRSEVEGPCFSSSRPAKESRMSEPRAPRLPSGSGGWVVLPRPSLRADSYEPHIVMLAIIWVIWGRQARNLYSPS